MSDITRTTADTAGFVPQYWASRALDVLRSNIVLAQVVARDTDFGEVGWEGKTITVPYPGTFVAQDKAAGTPITPQVPSGGQSVSLTLDHHKVVGFLVEDFGAAVANGSLFERYIEPATVAIAEQLESDLMLTAASLNPTLAPIGTAATDLTSAITRSAMVKLNNAKAPMANRSLVISAKDESALLGDSNLATYFAFSQADSIRNGYVGRLYTFDAYMSQLAPLGSTVTFGGGNSTLTYGGQTTPSQTAASVTAATLQAALEALSSVGTGNVKVVGPTAGPFSVVFAATLTGTLTASTATITANQTNFAIHKNALMYACRPFEPIEAAAGVMTATANDPESGLSIRISTQYDINNSGVRCNLDILYGVTALRTTQGQVIVT